MPRRPASRHLPVALGLAILTAPACAPAGLAPAPTPSAQASAGAIAAPSPAAAAGQAAPLHRKDAATAAADRDADGLPDAHEQALGLDAASAQADADRDGLPDAEEARLGTDPNKRDSDGDGLTDLFEHAASHPAHRDRFPAAPGHAAPGHAATGALVAAGGGNLVLLQAGAHTDSDGDGTHNALDADGNNDGVPDGEEDWDGDEVPNALEAQGYLWDATTRKFRAVQAGDPRVGYKTDPMLKSSDYDPYPDGVEAKGYATAGANELNPCKTLFPEIAMTVDKVEWRPTGTITFESGGSVTTGESHDTTTEESTTTESSTSISSTTTVEASVTAGTDGVNATGSVSEAVEYAESTSNSKTTSSSYTSSTSSESSQDWSTATTTDMERAATVTLTVSFKNHGKLQLNDVVPTVDLKIGDSTIGTFTLPDSIKSLGVSRQATPFTTTLRDIPLAMDQLKLMQAGAPFRATLTQFAGNVQAADPTSEVLTYKSIGEWYTYQDNIDENTVDLLLDDGAGKVTHARAYAPQASIYTSPPEVTLREVMAWAFGGQVRDGKLTLAPNPDEPEETSSIGDWMFFVNKRIYNLVAKTPAYQGNMLAVPMVGGRDAILAKAAPKGDFQKYPRLLYVEQPAGTRKLQVVAQDYVGIRSVALRGARDFASYAFKAPSPYADPKSGMVAYTRARDLRGGYIRDERQAKPAGVKGITSFQAGVEAREVIPMALSRVAPNGLVDLATLGWAADRYDGILERTYLGPTLEMHRLHAEHGRRLADILDASRVLLEPIPDRVDAKERADLEAARAKRATLAAQSAMVHDAHQVIVVTNTRGRVSVYDALGNFLRFEDPAE